MKKSVCLFVIPMFLCSFNAEAQFLKKLKKKVEQKVEETVTKNVSDKAASETDKSLNKVWEQKMASGEIPMGAEMLRKDEIPESYDFDWEVTMDMATRDGKMQMVYLIKEDAPYLGVNVPGAQNMTTVVDHENDINVMYMNSSGNKYVTGTRLEEITEDVNTFYHYEDMEITEVAPKTIMEYHCRGYKMENEEYTYLFYVTEDAEINFTDMYRTNQQDLPKGFNPDWLQEKTGFLMQMEMKDKRNGKNDVTMTCTSITKKDFTIRTADYDGFGGR